MSGGAAAGQGPSIRIVMTPGDAPRIEQRRPRAVRALIGRPAMEALAAVPLLLPICGEAQRVAAMRAIEAARGEPASAEVERWRDVGLLAERAVSIAWRLAVDWPGLVGAAPDILSIKRVRESARPIAEAARAAATALPQEPSPGAIDEALDATADRLRGLAAAATGEDLDRLLKRVSDDPSPMAEVLRRAAAAPLGLGQHDGHRLGPEALAEIAAEALAHPDFDPEAPGAAAIEVGPLAAVGDPVVAEAERRLGAGVLARLLAGARAASQWRHASRQVLEGYAPAPRPPVAVPDGAGIGVAMTARGPVLHRITLAEPAIADWRVMAPTDWHFATNGPVSRMLQASSTVDPNQSDAALAAASFDPCARCVVEVAGHA